VYHEKHLSAVYSSIMRVLARRLLALLRPEWNLNILKDNIGIEEHVSAHHPWGARPAFLSTLKYLENDFSKFDKSQGEFVFLLEMFGYGQLGLTKELADRWFVGHNECTIRAIGLGLVLCVDWQRKSGDASTSLGNGYTNLLAICYAYRGTKVIWAEVVGDDSLICSSYVTATPKSLDLLAQVFNLSAKFFITPAPYFGSNFVVLDYENFRAILAPDPFKRVQKLGVAVNAVDPNWEDRLRSHCETCEVYKYSRVRVPLEPLVRERYPVPAAQPLQPMFNALGYTASDAKVARRAWRDKSTTIVY